MKNIFSTLIIILSTLTCSCQNYPKAWVPEQYVKAMILKDTSANKYLIPIEGFESSEDKVLYILMYKGELNPLKIEKVKINGIEKDQLLNLQYYVNLKYNSSDLANQIANAKIYLSKSGEKLHLEIHEKDKTEDYFFVDRVDGHKFETIIQAKKYLQ